MGKGGQGPFLAFKSPLVVHFNTQRWQHRWFFNLRKVLEICCFSSFRSRRDLFWFEVSWAAFWKVPFSKQNILLSNGGSRNLWMFGQMAVFLCSSHSKNKWKDPCGKIFKAKEARTIGGKWGNLKIILHFCKINSNKSQKVFSWIVQYKIKTKCVQFRKRRVLRSKDRVQKVFPTGICKNCVKEVFSTRICKNRLTRFQLSFNVSYFKDLKSYRQICEFSGFEICQILGLASFKFLPFWVC